MFNNPDWDPLETLNTIIVNAETQSTLTRDIARALNNHAESINELNKTINGLNLRICILENQLSEAEIEIANLNSRT